MDKLRSYWGMKKIIGYLKDYWKTTDKVLPALALAYLAVAIFINYYFGLNRAISAYNDSLRFLCWYLVFLASFAFGYIILFLRKKNRIRPVLPFLVLLFLAPAIFAWKMSAGLHLDFGPDRYANIYWNQVIYWPFKLLIVIIILWITWKIFDAGQPFYGTSWKNFEAKPYLLMLFMMIPLVAAASTQPDFLAMYPKLKNVLFLKEENNFFHVLLYELSYGSDFIGIEIFFRGFLVLAFAKYAGKDSIIPMAIFYCTIHFGKPLGECISSFFGGMILGIVTYHTRTIWGGLMVHLGIAWMMELGGYIGNLITD